MEAFEDLQKRLPRPFGMWNCKHSMHPILLGISPNAYSEEELKEYREYSTEKIEIDGVTKTRYEWTLQQRRIETAVRYQKDAAIAAQAAGDNVQRRRSQLTINALMDRYDRVSEAAGIHTEYNRMRVDGFKHTNDKALRKNEDADRFSKATFKNENTLNKHVAKHAGEYGGIDADEYVERARNLLRAENGNDIMKLTRSDGSIAKYRISTNEFVASDAKGNIRTAFKPANGIEYWEEELKRNHAD